MNYIKIKELLERYDTQIRDTAMMVLEEEEQKISLLNPRGIKEQLRKVIEEMISE